MIFDSGLGDESIIVSYVATDNYHGGALAARRLAEVLGSQTEALATLQGLRCADMNRQSLFASFLSRGKSSPHDLRTVAPHDGDFKAVWSDARTRRRFLGTAAGRPWR